MTGKAGVAGVLGVTAMVGDRAVIVCVGPGGVGKTSVAAAVGLLGARAGRRVVVLTVDPARRLADALGLADLGLADQGNHGVVGARAVAGPWPGELWATMLDARSTFDELIRRHAVDPAQAEVILANRLYRNLAGTLAGTQEFMAAERLLELHLSEHFDLVVVDTPPSTNALDFLAAPQRVLRFLDSRAYRLLMAPSRSSARVVGLATGAVLRSISRVVGSEVLADTSEFFAAFEGMEAGFRSRSEQVRDLLSHPDTAFLVVTSLQTDRVDDASTLVAGLSAGGHLDGRGPDGVVANRTHPSFGPWDGAHWEHRSQELAATSLGSAAAALAAMQRRADEEVALLESLGTLLGAGFTARIPELDSDVHDMTGIAAIAAHLAGDVAGHPRGLDTSPDQSG